MGVIIDLILVGFVALCAWRGWRAGLIRGVCSVVALVAAIYLANIVATAYSGEFTGMLKPFASGVVDTLVSEALSGEETGSEDSGGDASDIVDVFAMTVPHFELEESDARSLTMYVMERVGLSESAAARVSITVAEESESITAGLTARITDKLCGILAYIAVFLVCFLLLAIIFAVIGNLINIVFSLPGLELLDSISGAVFGVMKALLLLFTLTIALRYFGILTADTVSKTAVLRYIVNANPIANILGI